MKITPEVIASVLGGTIEGNPDTEITGLAKIEEAKAGEISFIANSHYAPFAATTAASVLLVSNDFVKPEGTTATLIRVADPYASLAVLLSKFASSERKTGIEQPSVIKEGAQLDESCYVGAFSYIGKDARLGKNVMIYPHAYVGDNVEIGEGTVIRPNVTIYEGCRIGRNCIIHSGAVIGADGFGFAPEGEKYNKIPQIGIVEIGDDVEIGANCTIDRATMGTTEIKNGTKIDNLVHVAHNVSIGENNVFAAQIGIAGSTRIGDCNRIGGQVGFAGHINFGSHCEVGAQSGIHKNYGDRRRLMGYPAIDAADFARNHVYIKRLSRLFKEVEALKEEIKKQKQ